MAKSVPASLSQFSFDQMASEVNAIVEDLRWLHLELTLRNKCNEVLFQEPGSVEDVLALAFTDLRERIGALELTVFLRVGKSLRIGFRDIDSSLPWADDEMPWQIMAQRFLHHAPRDAASEAEVNHFTVNSVPVSAVSIPIIVAREFLASVVIVLQTSSTVSRLRKFLTGLAGAVGLSIVYTRNALAARHAGVETSSPESILPDRAPSDTDFAAFFDAIPAPVIAVAGTMRITRCSRSACELFGWTQGSGHIDQPLADLIHPDDRDASIAPLLSVPEAPESHIFVNMKLQDGQWHRVRWTIAPAGQAGIGMCVILLGIETEAPPTSERGATADLPAREARLSKQYRFMIKYVPFPVVHLDEREDIIRNANPAFESLIGTKRWEHAPLGDFGTLLEHPAAGDAVPCTLTLISTNGISVPYRGILTRLLIFGKLVREITFNPIEQQR